MKLSKNFHLWIVVALSVLLLGGCGVDKEEHEKVVSELNKIKAELEKATKDLPDMNTALEKANARIEELEKSLAEAQAKLESEFKEADKTVSGAVDEQLAASEKKVQELQESLKSLADENSKLKGMLDTLKKEYEAIKSKIGDGVQSLTEKLPGSVPKKQ